MPFWAPSDIAMGAIAILLPKTNFPMDATAKDNTNLALLIDNSAGALASRDRAKIRYEIEWIRCTLFTTSRSTNLLSLQ